MALEVGQAFKRVSGQAIDESLTLTKAEMLAVNDSLMPAKYLTVCQDDGKIYVYDKTNAIDLATGKFRIYATGGGGGSVEMTWDDTSHNMGVNEGNNVLSFRDTGDGVNVGITRPGEYLGGGEVAKKDYVDTELTGKQATLVSGTNIKTINNESILGSGNINIQGGGGSFPFEILNIDLSQGFDLATWQRMRSMIGISSSDTTQLYINGKKAEVIDLQDYSDPDEYIALISVEKGSDAILYTFGTTTQSPNILKVTSQVPWSKKVKVARQSATATFNASTKRVNLEMTFVSQPTSQDVVLAVRSIQFNPSNNELRDTVCMQQMCTAGDSKKFQVAVYNTGTATGTVTVTVTVLIGHQQLLATGWF